MIALSARGQDGTWVSDVEDAGMELRGEGKGLLRTKFETLRSPWWWFLLTLSFAGSYTHFLPSLFHL